MRLLHTSDWHLGQSLHNFDRHYEHQRFLDWLLDTIVSEQADALLVAGDIFDNANPSAASQRQLYTFLQQARARAPQLDIVVIAGNHDSPGRLEAPGPLLEVHGTTVIGYPHRDADGSLAIERMLVPLTGKDGATAAWVLAVPFLRHGDVPRLAPQEAADGEDAAPQADPYLAGIAELYRQALELAGSRASQSQAIVAMGHCHMVNGTMSAESERRIVIGGTEMLPTGIFPPPIAYAALGHLHLAQQVGPHAHIRYCGSPIPLSFAETSYTHQVLRIDLQGAQVGEITALPVPRAVQLLRVPEKPAPLQEVKTALAALELPDVPLEQQPLLEVRIRLAAPEPGLRAAIEEALQGKPVRLAKIETSSAARASFEEAALSLDQLATLQPDDIFKRLYQLRYGTEAPPEQLAAFAELVRP
ncbi:exonuclease SbcCD subunit D C-terminal domain-containing protein [Duganella sp. Root198D2]|uniref:exonuclease SbcCD subunit D C-terminal domain-containing protein n=1 Tax=Duganella sp. Root198D2 TaxID=1736489 RepID=UPI00070B83B6|nr:exonuclease SbcCD subunit D C-terminal domain-containing protein [Duganella sp. Root198D2]KRB81773.1 exonuclease SbcD [Duganella sp. Root198D2]